MFETETIIVASLLAFFIYVYKRVTSLILLILTGVFIIFIIGPVLILAASFGGSLGNTIIFFLALVLNAVALISLLWGVFDWGYKKSRFSALTKFRAATLMGILMLLSLLFAFFMVKSQSLKGR